MSFPGPSPRNTVQSALWDLPASRDAKMYGADHQTSLWATDQQRFGLRHVRATNDLRAFAVVERHERVFGRVSSYERHVARQERLTSTWGNHETIVDRLEAQHEEARLRRAEQLEAARAAVEELMPGVGARGPRLGPLVALLGDELGEAVLRLAANNGPRFATTVAASVCTIDTVLDALEVALTNHPHVPQLAVKDFRHQLIPGRSGEWTSSPAHVLGTVEGVLRAIAAGRALTVSRPQGDYYADRPDRRVSELRKVLELLELSEDVHKAVHGAALQFPELDAYRHGAHLRLDAEQLDTPPRAATGLALLLLATVLVEEGDEDLAYALRAAARRVASRIASVNYDCRNVPAARERERLEAAA